MTVHAHIYLVKDSHKNICTATCEETCTIINISGIKDENYNNLFFESDAYHLEKWCKKHNLQYKYVEKQYDFDELWNSNNS